MAGVLQMTYVGTPFIYYGAEAGMWGANDPDCRKPMVWDDLDHDPEFIGPQGQRVGPHDVRVDHDIHAFYRAAIAMRRQSPVLNHGDFKWLLADDKANTLAFVRKWQGSTALVVLNRAEEVRTIRLEAPEGWPEGEMSARFVSDGGSATLKSADGRLEMDLAPLTAVVFLP